MRRIFIALVVIAALAVPSVGTAGHATKQVKRKQVARALASAGIPEWGNTRLPKPAPRSTATRTYKLLTSGSRDCGTDTYTIVVDGRTGIPMC
jgi:hypothetical protein